MGLLNAAPPYSPVSKESCTSVRLIAGVHYLLRLRAYLKVLILTYINYNFVFFVQSSKTIFPPIFDDYFGTNASVHDHFIRSQSGLHAISHKTNNRL